MTPLHAWALIALVTACLWLVFRALGVVFSLIERRWERGGA